MTLSFMMCKSVLNGKNKVQTGGASKGERQRKENSVNKKALFGALRACSRALLYPGSKSKPSTVSFL